MIIAIIMDYQKKTESIEYTEASAITTTIRGTSKQKLYQKLGFESLNLYLYLYKRIPSVLNSYCNSGCYRALYCRTDLF